MKGDGVSWIGVDFDGTLSIGGLKLQDGRLVLEPGTPVWPMVARVRRWLAEGRTVKIFTARVSEAATRPDFTAAQIAVVQAFCREHIGTELEVTCVKDFGCTELWDDRARRVEYGTGLEYNAIVNLEETV